MPSSRRRFLALCLALPLIVIAGSYLWLAAAHGTPLLGDVIVHESGRYTLTETVLYFSHFLREIPVDIVMALFIVAAFTALTGRAVRVPRWMALVATVVAIALAGTAALVTIRQDGAASAQLDFLQFRTTDDSVGYGTHWHYHFASTLWFAFGAPVALRMLAAVAGIGAAPAPMSGATPWRAAWLVFAGLTLVFGVSIETLTSVRYTGHQARELMTHVPITLPLVFAALAAIGAPFAAARVTPVTDTWWTRVSRALADRPWQTAAAFAIPIALALVTLSGDPMEEGQAEQGLVAMVAGHVFEHVLDYAFTVSTAVALAAADGWRRDRRT